MIIDEEDVLDGSLNGSRGNSRKRRSRATKPEKVVKDKFKEEREAMIRPVVPKNENQAKMIESINKNMVTIAKGSAGTGKTFISASVLSNMYLKGEIDNIIVMRPAVRMGTQTGHWPGTLEEKLTPLLLPILSVIRKRIGELKYAAEIGKSIKIHSLEAVRGMSFDGRTAVIIDEAQNCVPDEIRSAMTRLEEGSKMILIGDDKQLDLRSVSGLVYLTDIVKKHRIPSCGVVEFTTEDIVRSGLVRRFVEIFEKEGSVADVEKYYKDK